MNVTKFNYVGFDENFDEYLQKHRRESLESGPHTLPIWTPRGIVEPGSVVTPDRTTTRKRRRSNLEQSSSSSSSSSSSGMHGTHRKRPKTTETTRKETVHYLKVAWKVATEKGTKFVWFKGITQSSLTEAKLKVSFPNDEDNPNKTYNVGQNSKWESMTKRAWTKMLGGEDVL